MNPFNTTYLHWLCIYHCGKLKTTTCFFQFHDICQALVRHELGGRIYHPKSYIIDKVYSLSKVSSPVIFLLPGGTQDSFNIGDPHIQGRLPLNVTCFFSSALCYCTAELLSSRGRPSVCRPSVKPVFSEPVGHINAKFGGKVPFYHISRPFFLFFKILNFWFFTIFFRFR